MSATSTPRDEGNPNLRFMSPMMARSLCRAVIRDDPEAVRRYKEYEEDQKDIFAQYGPSFRGVGGENSGGMTK